jgi:putative transposase
LADKTVRVAVHTLLAAKGLSIGGRVWAVGGVDDHVHLLVTVPPTIALSQFVGQVKGATFYLTSRKWPAKLAAFAWQDEYCALTISQSRFDIVAEYVRNQELRHSDHKLIAALERFG